MIDRLLYTIILVGLGLNVVSWGAFYLEIQPVDSYANYSFPQPYLDYNVLTDLEKVSE